MKMLTYLAIGWKYYGAYVAILTVYLALFWYSIRETRGLTVEEASTVYDDDYTPGVLVETEQALAVPEARNDKASSINEVEYKATV